MTDIVLYEATLSNSYAVRIVEERGAACLEFAFKDERFDPVGGYSRFEKVAIDHLTAEFVRLRRELANAQTALRAILLWHQGAEAHGQDGAMLDMVAGALEVQP